jgi:histidyl-tRNA synthetase
MASKPGIPKGTRDFHLQRWQNDISSKLLKIILRSLVFNPETPSFENSETLMGKYGEGDR